MNNIKPMSLEEMVLALDRISRFKLPEKKLKRVYIETLNAHLISPSLKKTDIEKFDNKSLTQYFTDIWNYSINKIYSESSQDFSLNNKYIEQEKNCYLLTKDILDLMPKKVDFRTLLKNLPQKQIPNNFNNYKTPQKIVLTEGITEEILLPEFSKVLGYNWTKNGVKIISTGGKSKILSFYNLYKSQLKIPIFVLLDLDAKPVFEQLKKGLRKSDNAHLISAGEIEDIIPVNLFKNAINSQYKLQTKISLKDFEKSFTMVENLHNIYRINGFGEFKKPKVANLIKETITKNTTLSDELILILEKIKEL